MGLDVETKAVATSSLPLIILLSERMVSGACFSGYPANSFTVSHHFSLFSR